MLKIPPPELELLRELASCGDKTICKAVVSNPNTPTDVLLALGAKFPGQLLENPLFSLLLLENPNFLAQMPWETQYSLYSYHPTPEKIRASA